MVTAIVELRSNSDFESAFALHPTRLNLRVCDDLQPEEPVRVRRNIVRHNIKCMDCMPHVLYQYCNNTHHQSPLTNCNLSRTRIKYSLQARSLNSVHDNKIYYGNSGVEKDF